SIRARPSVAAPVSGRTTMPPSPAGTSNGPSKPASKWACNRTGPSRPNPKPISSNRATRKRAFGPTWKSASLNFEESSWQGRYFDSLDRGARYSSFQEKTEDAPHRNGRSDPETRARHHKRPLALQRREDPSKHPERQSLLRPVRGDRGGARALQEPSFAGALPEELLRPRAHRHPHQVQ